MDFLVRREEKKKRINSDRNVVGQVVRVVRVSILKAGAVCDGTSQLSSRPSSVWVLLFSMSHPASCQYSCRVTRSVPSKNTQIYDKHGYHVVSCAGLTAR